MEPEVNRGTKVALPYESWYYYYPSLPKEVSLDASGYQRLWDLHPQEHGTVIMYGKELDVPRWQKAYGRDYKFSRMNHVADPLTDPFLLKLLAWVNQHSGRVYNSALLNWYANGLHYIGKHADDESQLVPQSPIYSFSFGETRNFRISSKANVSEKIEPITLELHNNSLVVMAGKMQTYYLHEVPKVTGKKGEALKSRINVTFRQFK
jgi:alkylated DNA repair dioxygenase AlkB